MAVRDDRSDVKQTTTGFRGPLMVQSLTSAKSKFLSLLLKANSYPWPIVIGVAGGTGSGKTTVVRAIADKMNPPDVVIIQHDFYYKDRSHLP